MGKIILEDNSGLLNSKTIISEGGKVEVIHTQDIEPILEKNKALQNDRSFKNGFSAGGDMKHVASVPVIIWEQWWQEECKRRGKHIPFYGKEMHEIIIAKLNDPENKFLRTGLGQIGGSK